MTKRLTVLLAVLGAIGLMQTGSGAPNLAANPGFEQSSGPTAAEQWEAVVKGAAAQFHLDEQVFRSGRRSMRIDAGEVTRAYIRSQAIPVAPGEKLRISAWARTRDVPADQGTTIVIAEFLNAGGGPAGELKKVGTARPGSPWQRISGEVEAPGLSDSLRLRLGFSYSRGTVWWDDVEVEPAHDRVVARPDLSDGRLYPAAGGVPVTILNRGGQRGSISVRATLGQERSTSRVTLTGERFQRVVVPLKIDKRGKHSLQIEAFDGESVLFSPPPMAVIVPPPLTFGPLTPTHGVVEDGPTVLAGEVEVALDAGAPQHGRMTVSVVGPDGQVRASRELDQVAPAAVCRFDVPVPSVEEAEYAVRVVLSRQDGTALSAEEKWKVVRRGKIQVVINSDGFPERAGRAMFPLGMFNNGGRLEESATAGFNVVHTYNAARVQPGRRPDDQRLKDLLDRAEKAGMHCLLLVPMEYAFVGDWDGFTRRIRMFRNHPALLAWDEEEGIARGDMDRAALARMRAILSKEDPHHPFMVGDSHDVIGRVADRGRMFPADLMDMGMWWWYPLPLKRGPGDALQGETPQGRLELDPPAFLTRQTTGKPVWVGLQSYKKPGPDGRYPTPAEYRAQAYLAVIHGARGLMWYGGSVTGGVFLNPEEGRWDELKRVVRELNDLAAVLMGRSLEAPVLDPVGVPVSAAVKAAPAGRLLLAVNRSMEAQEVGMKVPGLTAAVVNVRGEDRTVAAAAGVIRDRFAPLAVHLYELPKP